MAGTNLRQPRGISFSCPESAAHPFHWISVRQKNLATLSIYSPVDLCTIVYSEVRPIQFTGTYVQVRTAASLPMGNASRPQSFRLPFAASFLGSAIRLQTGSQDKLVDSSMVFLFVALLKRCDALTLCFTGGPYLLFATVWKISLC